MTVLKRFLNISENFMQKFRLIYGIPYLRGSHPFATMINSAAAGDWAMQHELDFFSFLSLVRISYAG